jgi:hypothetical protein
MIKMTTENSLRKMRADWYDEGYEAGYKNGKLVNAVRTEERAREEGYAEGHADGTRQTWFKAADEKMAEHSTHGIVIKSITHVRGPSMEYSEYRMHLNKATYEIKFRTKDVNNGEITYYTHDGNFSMDDLRQYIASKLKGAKADGS